MPAKDPAAYMREYRRRRKGASAATEAPAGIDLASLESPDADWRSLPPVAALVALARALPDESPLGGEDIAPSRTLDAPDARWRTLAPRVAFRVLSMTIAATIAGTD